MRMSIKNLSGNLVINTNEESSFTITVSELQGLSGFKEIQIPFLVSREWYERHCLVYSDQTTRWSYSVTVKASDHENAYGTYEGNCSMLIQKARINL